VQHLKTAFKLLKTLIMKRLLIILFCSCFYNMYSQENLSVLAVSGEAKLLVMPDITVINIDLNSTNLDYSQAIKDLQKKTDDLKSFLKNKGITTKYFKSEAFQVDKQYAYDKGTRKYEGYNAKLSIKLEFLNNNDLANMIINAIGSSNVDAEININFEISTISQDSINNRLIEAAIKDAKIKANLIAKSTDQKISKIERINYGVKDNIVLDNSNDVLYCVLNDAVDDKDKTFSITPKAIEKMTQIIIIWQLEKNK
jgi:uncharacterized protein